MIARATRQPAFASPPGCLLKPFDWATAEIVASLTRDPHLACDLVWLSTTRLHLIGLCLANCTRDVGPDGLRFIIRRRIRQVLRDMVPGSPPGLRRVLQHLPPRILPADDYRSLVRLLCRRHAGSILRHARTIDNGLIRLLEGVPDALRRAVMASVPPDMWYRMSRLRDSLQIVAARLGLPLKDIIADLACATANRGAFTSRLAALVERLPLPDSYPPPSLGSGRRIDRPSELRSLARDWANCLADYVDPVQAGETAFYVWTDDDGGQAICQVNRAGRLGWVLADITGPKNSPAPPQTAAAISAAFAPIDVHPAAVILPIETLLLGMDFAYENAQVPE